MIAATATVRKLTPSELCGGRLGEDGNVCVNGRPVIVSAGVVPAHLGPKSAAIGRIFQHHAFGRDINFFPGRGGTVGQMQVELDGTPCAGIDGTSNGVPAATIAEPERVSARNTATGIGRYHGDAKSTAKGCPL